MTEEKELVEAKSFADMFGREFDENGKATNIRDTGKTPLFQRMNRKQRRKQGMYSHKFQKVLKRV